MLIQYVSDLHLEFLNRDKVMGLIKTTTGADVIVLAGDICAVAALESDFEKLLHLIGHLSKKYKYVIHIAGNHEYYTNVSRGITEENTMAVVNRKLKAIEKIIPNYKYLNRTMIQLSINGQKYGFIGCTLWTHVAPANRKFIQDRMNDYNAIYVKKTDGVKNFSIEDMQILYRKNVAFIKQCVEVAEKENLPCILITHHKPFEEGLKDELRQAYETDLSKVIKAPIKAVIFGHCHKSYDKIIDNVRYLSNCLGYRYQHTGYKNDATFSV